MNRNISRFFLGFLFFTLTTTVNSESQCKMSIPTFFTNKRTINLNLKGSQIGLSSEQISDLYTTFSSTTNSASTDAITLLTTIADSYPSLAVALFNIINGLSQADSDHAGRTPLDVATGTVKLTLATTNIPSRHGTNTLLHYAALFDILAPIIDSEIDASAKGAEVISALLSDLTTTQRTTALTAKDTWESTPLHYAALSNDENATIMSALVRNVNQKNAKAAIIGAKNTWGYTPVHNAAASSNVAIIDPLFHSVSIAQKFAALSAKDELDNTPFHYAALAGNSSIIDPLFLTGITTNKLFTLLTSKNKFDSTPLHYLPFADNRSIIDPLFLTMTPAQKTTAITLKNQWDFTPLTIATLPRIQDADGSWVLPDTATAFFAALMHTPNFDMATTVWPSILGAS